MVYRFSHMKRILLLLLLLLFNVSLMMAQSYPRKCTEEDIPSGRRAKYYEEAHQVVQDFYMLLLESVGNTDNRDVIIDQLINDDHASTLKTDFLLTQDHNLSFCNPLQYFTKFESIYKDLVEEVEFVVDNFKDGKIMMNSLVSCYIPIEYDLTLMQGDKTLFKRRCRMYCLFPKANASKLVKVMQVEPVKDIISCKSVADSKSEKMASGTPDEWNKIGGKFYENKEYKKAVVWWQKAANQGYAKSQYNLGNCYSEGLGVPQSDVNAVKWYNKAAEQEHADAQNNLGYCYIKGLGVPQSDENAVKWYTKAAEKGLASAQYNLGICYEKGQGVTQSYEKAVKWYTKAAEQGSATAQYNLGLCYEFGKGVPQSFVKAAEWYTKSLKNGNHYVKEDLDRLKKKQQQGK